MLERSWGGDESKERETFLKDISSLLLCRRPSPVPPSHTHKDVGSNFEGQTKITNHTSSMNNNGRQNVYQY